MKNEKRRKIYFTLFYFIFFWGKENAEVRQRERGQKNPEKDPFSVTLCQFRINFVNFS